LSDQQFKATEIKNNEHHDGIDSQLRSLRVARDFPPARRLVVLFGDLGIDLGRLGPESRRCSSRSRRSVVDLDSRGCCSGMCGAALRSRRRSRSWPTTGALAGPMVVVPGCPRWTVGVLSDSRRYCHAAWRAVDRRTTVCAYAIDSRARTDVPASGHQRWSGRGAGLARLSTATTPQSLPSCSRKPDPRVRLVAVAPAAHLDSGRRHGGPAAVVTAG
jgi:hypothetical protein